MNYAQPDRRKAEMEERVKTPEIPDWAGISETPESSHAYFLFKQYLLYRDGLRVRPSVRRSTFVHGPISSYSSRRHIHCFPNQHVLTSSTTLDFA